MTLLKFLFWKGWPRLLYAPLDENAIQNEGLINPSLGSPLCIFFLRNGWLALPLDTLNRNTILNERLTTLLHDLSP